MFKYLSDPENGLVKVKEVNGLEFTMKLLPQEYLAYRELKDQEISDSSLKLAMDQYDSTYTFLLTIGPAESLGNDFSIQWLDISNYEEYRERVLELNFDIEDYISVVFDGGSVPPALTNMENVYGLSKSRNIYLVFAPTDSTSSLLNAPELDIVFNDEIFNSGINHFVFNKEDIDRIPTINFWKRSS